MQRFLKLALVAGILLASGFGARVLGIDRILTLEGMRAWVDSWGSLGPLAFVGVCVFGIVFYLPESMLITFGGALFGSWSAFAYGWLAAVIGTTLTFVIARYLAREYVQRTLAARGDWFRRFDERFSRHGLFWVFLLRAGLGLAPPLNWTVGATSVTLPSYMVGTALGVVPNLALFAYFGGSVADAVERGNWLDPHVVLPAVLVTGFITAGVILGHRLFREEPG